jgi:hypothetical protein
MAVVRPLFLALLACAVVASCSDDQPDGSPDITCTVLFAAGVDTPDLDRQPQCRSGDDVVKVASDRWECEGGGELFANEWGHGVKGEPWSTDGTIDDGSDAGSPLADAIERCQ